MPTDRARDMLIAFANKVHGNLDPDELQAATEDYNALVQEVANAGQPYGLSVNETRHVLRGFAVFGGCQYRVELRLKNNPVRIEATPVHSVFDRPGHTQILECRWDRANRTWIGRVPTRDSRKTAPVHRVETALSTLLPLLARKD